MVAGEERAADAISSAPLDDEIDEDKLEERLRSVGIVEAPDGGYGWVVLFAAFACNVIVDGIIFTA